MFFRFSRFLREDPPVSSFSPLISRIFTDPFGQSARMSEIRGKDLEGKADHLAR
jgi:hypothetical protein